MNTGYHDGEYSLISGHVEAGETFSKAMIRETLEEAGIIIKPSNLIVKHIMQRKSDFDGSERVDVYFETSLWQGKLTNNEPEKCSELKWFSLDRLPDNIIPCVKSAINNSNKGIMYSEFGWE